MFSHNLNLKIFLEETILFAVIGIISIFSTEKIYKFSKVAALSISWWQFLLAFGAGTAVILILIRVMHGGFFLRLFFLLAVFSGVFVTLGVFLNNNLAFTLSFILVAVYHFYPYVWFHDAVLVLTLPGVASAVGASLMPYAAAVLLIFMSIYDYIAVYKTKHMVRMAKAMIAGRAIFAMILPEYWHGFKSRIDAAQPGEGFMMLGTGDFVFPIIMAVSAYAVSAAAAWLVFFFSLFGLLLMHLIFMFQKTRRPMPALPPLAAFAILGFILSIILKI